MKRSHFARLVGVTLASFSLIFAGCANQETPISGASPEPKTIYADMIPDPKVIFTDSEINITDPDGGTAYIFEVSNFKDGEFESFVAGCKERGFDDVAYEYKDDFGAYSSDGLYWARAIVDHERNIIIVFCMESKKNSK